MPKDGKSGQSSDEPVKGRDEPGTRRPPRARPRPSRHALDAAEKALAQQEREAKAALAIVEEKQARLQAEIERLRKRHQAASRPLVRRVASERSKYHAALDRWRAS